MSLARMPTQPPEGTRLYLRPVGLVVGADAVALIGAGRARRLAGAVPLAFTAAELVLRWPAGEARTTAPVDAILAWAEQGDVTLREALAGWFEHLGAPRQRPGGGLLVRPLLMGIVNVTPDSFSDAGEALDPGAAVERAVALAEAGADIVDIGGESTRPGAQPVPPEVEIGRIRPVLERLARDRSPLRGALLSIDTRRAAVMRVALGLGADLVNDVSALADPESLPLLAGSRAAVVLMHMPDEPATMNRAPAYRDVVLDVFDHLAGRVVACRAAGIAAERLIVDPGIGFGKRGAQNLAVLRALPLFQGLGCPVLLGLSRKGLGEAHHYRHAPKDRRPGSLAAAALALEQGVQLLRVHDVAETRQAVDLWCRLRVG
ncbi:MAG: dihydropteroate synthase [Dongiaceae bacterium]